MSKFDFGDYAPLKKENEFRWEDRITIEKLLLTNKLTEKQREAIRRLLATYDCARS